MQDFLLRGNAYRNFPLMSRIFFFGCRFTTHIESRFYYTFYWMISHVVTMHVYLWLDRCLLWCVKVKSTVKYAFIFHVIRIF